MTDDQENKDTASITVNGVPMSWQLERGTLSFYGFPAIIFSLDPSLLHMMTPLVRELGVELARYLIASGSGHGADPDYQFIVAMSPDDFVAGFLSWGRAVGAAGWGRFEVLHYDQQQKRARVRVENPWEIIMQKNAPSSFGCPFLQGKIIGLFSRGLGVNCWADEIVTKTEAGDDAVEFQVYSSSTTIALELARLAQERKSEREEQLQRALNRQSAALLQRELQLHTILRNSPGIIYAVDMQGTFVFSDGQQLSLLGLKPGEVVGQNAFEMYKDYPSAIDCIQAGLRGEERSWDVYVTSHHFSNTCVPLRDTAGEINGAIVFSLDITDRVNIQEALAKKKDALEQEVHEKQQTIIELATPIIRVWEGILLVPLIGTLDEGRAVQLMETVLSAISFHHASEVIIDVTGVAVFDAQVAAYLIKCVQAARLLGVTCTMVGISPAVAQTLVRLGADLSQVKTYANLENGLKKALGRLRYQVVRSPEGGAAL